MIRSVQFFRVEIRRNLTQPSVFLWLAVVVGLSVYETCFKVQSLDARAPGSLVMLAGDWFQFLVTLIAGGAGASSLAEDRQRQYTALTLARGLSRTEYLLAKAAASCLSTGLATLMGLGLFYAMAAVFFPAGRWSRAPFPTFPGPWPELFQANPLLNDLLACAMWVMAAAALSLVSLLSGIFFRNERAAMMAPFMFVVVGAFALRSCEAINPITYLDVANVYPREVSDDWRPYLAFVYWLLLGGAVLLASHARFTSRELD